MSIPYDITWTVDIDRPDFPGKVVLTAYDGADAVQVGLLDPDKAEELARGLLRAAAATRTQQHVRVPQPSSIAVVRENYGPGLDS